MKYFISRGGQQYGPYAAPDLQRYLSEGSIQYSDLARTETMSEWLPLSQLLQSGQLVAQNAPPNAVFPQSTFAPPSRHGVGPIPPALHWAFVLVLGMITGLFHYVWMFVQAGFIKKIDPQSKATLLYVLGLLAMVGGVVVALVFAFAMSSGTENRDPNVPAIVTGLIMMLVVMVGSAFILAGAFSIRSSMLQHYNTVEPIQLRLSPLMTFFFNTLYIQYHFTRIAKWKETGIIYPQ
jgi:heme/copper-type cytochrome/quinol oxidase subunit 4